MKFKLMTPGRTLFEGDVTSVSGEAPKGAFEVLERHGAWVSPLGIAPLTAVIPDSDNRSFAVHGGIVEVGPDSVLVLADIAETADEIDAERAQRALNRAKAQIEAGTGRGERAAVACRAMDRAEARLAVTVARK